MRLLPWTPGEVVSFDQQTGIVRVKFEALGDAEEYPEAMLNLPIGDKSWHTSIRILPGDLVWLDFVGGDPRFPIILGYRAPEQGNVSDIRRLHHKVMEFRADTDMTLEAASGVMTIRAGSQVRIVAPAVLVDAPMTVTGSITGQAGLAVSGSFTNNGKNVGSTHVHTGVDRGSASTDPPP